VGAPPTVSDTEVMVMLLGVGFVMPTVPATQPTEPVRVCVALVVKGMLSSALGVVLSPVPPPVLVSFLWSHSKVGSRTGCLQ
jgi:hypothetical protein